MALLKTIRARATKRRAGATGSMSLNLVSLIDILTTLVFFLLVTAASVQTIVPAPGVSLPASRSTLQPQQVAQVIVTPDEIRVGPRVVESVADALKEPGATLVGLDAALRAERAAHRPAAAAPPPATDATDATDAVNILADKRIPFWLLRKVISSCSAGAGFAHISLAVMHVN